MVGSGTRMSWESTKQAWSRGKVPAPGSADSTQTKGGDSGVTCSTGIAQC